MFNLERIADRVIEYTFCLLFFLVPLILTPWNFELFEFNKMILVYLLTIIIAASWLLRMVAQKKFIFQRTFWDIPLIVFLISQIISCWFSIDRHTSFWGYYSRFNGGLASTICYLILYWAFVSNLNKTKVLKAIKLLLITGLIVASYGIAEHFGIDAKYWVQDVRNRVFSTLGQPNWLAAWLVALIPLTWVLGSNSKAKKFTVYCLLFTVYYLCLLYTGSRSGILGFGVAFLLFWGLTAWLNRQKLSSIRTPFLIFTFVLLLLTLSNGSPYTPSVKELISQPQPNVPEQPAPAVAEVPVPLLISESGEIRKVVWSGAIKIWRDHPFWGTGPETFAYSYYWYRPKEHNLLSEWDFLYNKAHNEYLNLAANTGIIGLLAHLALIAVFLIWSLKNSSQSPLVPAFPAGFASMVVTNFFGFSVVPVSLLFYLFPAVAFVISQDKIKDKTKPTSFPPLSLSRQGLTGLILVLTLALLVFISRYWYADSLYASGEKLNEVQQFDQGFYLLQKAVQLRPIEPVYHDELAYAAASLAVLIAQQDASQAAELEQIALTNTNQAIQVSPYNLNFWKNRTKVFYYLGQLNEDYYQQALATLETATQIAPTEPKLRYNLGLIYAQLNQTDQAIRVLEETIELKANYEDPRYALALFYEQKGELARAREQLEAILSFNPASTKAQEKLEQINP